MSTQFYEAPSVRTLGSVASRTLGSCKAPGSGDVSYQQSTPANGDIITLPDGTLACIAEKS